MIFAIQLIILLYWHVITMFQVLCMQLLAVIVICGAFNSKLRPKTGPNILKMADKEKVVVLAPSDLGAKAPTHV